MGQFIFTKLNLFIKKKINKNLISGIIMPNNRSVDIDYLEDFNYAEYLLRKI